MFVLIFAVWSGYGNNCPCPCLTSMTPNGWPGARGQMAGVSSSSCTVLLALSRWHKRPARKEKGKKYDAAIFEYCSDTGTGYTTGLSQVGRWEIYPIGLTNDIMTILSGGASYLHDMPENSRLHHLARRVVSHKVTQQLLCHPWLSHEICRSMLDIGYERSCVRKAESERPWYERKVCTPLI
ncbi:hypothetical protein F4680DRAFT_378325 [Xylaria scruposa]|nr:hypothetical protein F4680DRAFT_378325 [Xylaria scruposa]